MLKEPIGLSKTVPRVGLRGERGSTETYFLASILASESASCIPFFIVSANTDMCLDS